jgi:hypothetical protein
MSSNIFGYSTATNFSNRLPDTAALANLVTLNTTQTITGQKTFTAPLTVAGLDATTINSSGTITTDTALNVQKLSENRGAVLIVSDPGYGTYNPIVETYDSVIMAKTVDNTLNLSALTLTANGSTRLGVRISAIVNTVWSYSGNNQFVVGPQYVVAVAPDFRVQNPTTQAGQFLVKPHSSSGDYNSLVQAGDVVLCARNQYNDFTNQGNNAITLTARSATNSGVRVTYNAVTMGAGGSGTNPSAYLTVIDGGTPQSVGPIPATTDSSSKIATTQWVQSLAPFKFNVFVNPLSLQQNNIYLDNNVLGTINQTCVVMISSPVEYVGVTIQFRFPIPAGNYVGKQVTIRWGNPSFGLNWSVASWDATTPLMVAGVSQSNSAAAYYIMNGYVATTWMCDGVYWYLLSRV